MGTDKKVPANETIKSRIEAWKKKHGAVYRVTTTDEKTSELDFYLIKPDMIIMSAVLKVADSDPLKSTQILFQNCLLNKENEHYVDDVDVMMSISPHLELLIEQREATIKKL